MKTLQVSKDIIPLAQFKSHASKVFRQLHDEQRPIIVTQNGQAAAVLITPEEFDRLQDGQREPSQVPGLSKATEDSSESFRHRKTLTFNDFLANRLERPEGIEPVSLEDMERAIEEGAVDEGL